MRQKNYLIWFFFTMGIYISLIAGSVCHGVLGYSPKYEIVTNAVLSLILAYLLNYAVKQIQLKRDRRLQDKALFIVLFFAANLLLALGGQEFCGFLWLLPVVMAAMCSGAEQAFVVFVALLAQNVMLFADSFSAKGLLITLIFGVVCIWLLVQKLTWQALIYMGIIMLAVDGALQILRYQFLLSSLRSDWQVVATEGASVLVLYLFICGYLFYRRKKGKETEEDLEQQRHLRKSLSKVLEADYGLLLRLQEYSGQLFVHSMRISSASAQAARHMGGDVQLAQAGGLYHEIGRITGEKDYVEAGVRLTEENDFPEDLIAVIRQHSTGKEKPQSLEAAIVMFTDCIISTSEYLERNGKRAAISDEKLVDSIFQNRIAKGTLSESGLSDEDLERLRLFYVQQIFMTEAETGEKQKG